jgi:hypothetical protein
MFSKFKILLFIIVLINVFDSHFIMAFGKKFEGDSAVDTGGFGEFTPRAFLQASKTWTVFRAVGRVSKGGFPCDFTGGSCFYDKDYRFEEVFPQQQKRLAEIGTGWPLFTVNRKSSGTLRTIEMKNLANRTLLRMDKISSTGRLGVEGAFTTSAQRIDQNGNGIPLG